MEKNSFHIVTLGCKVNTFESQEYAQALKDLGYQECEENADIYLVNTCAVTNMAASKCRQKIHSIKRDNPKAFLCAIGCYVQVSKDKIDELDDCDVLIGTRDKHLVAEIINEAFKEKQRKILISEKEEEILHNLPLVDFPMTRAYLKVQDGCNQFCTYCIIPYARGRERSLPYQEAILQAKKLVDSNHKELVLTGIHTGRYNDGKHDLYDLMVGLLNEVNGLERIRLSSIELTEVTDKIIDLMANDSRIAHHLHIPLQAASDEVLSAMHRPYTIKEYQERIDYIKERIPDISISCDIITGFPGETDEIFNSSLINLEKIPLSFMHIFPYSLRKGTVASKMKNHIDGKVKKERVAVLTKISSAKYLQYQQSKIGQILEVYVESIKNGYYFGHSSEYIPVYFKANEDVVNKFVKVKAIKTDNACVYGELI